MRDNINIISVIVQEMEIIYSDFKEGLFTSGGVESPPEVSMFSIIWTSSLHGRLSCSITEQRIRRSGII